HRLLERHRRAALALAGVEALGTAVERGTAPGGLRGLEEGRRAHPGLGQDHLTERAAGPAGTSGGTRGTGRTAQRSAMSSRRPSENSHHASGSQSPLTKASTVAPRPRTVTVVPGG